jgi:hypothetical protein
VPNDPDATASEKGTALNVREGTRKMGRVALEGQAGGNAGRFTGSQAGPQDSMSWGVSRSRHHALAWKPLGRPACLPAAIPLDLRAG